MTAAVRTLRTPAEITEAGLSAGTRDGQQAGPQASARLALLLAHARTALTKDEQPPGAA